MSEIPHALRYSQSHEWVKVDSDGLCVIGITDYAQSQLGDIVYFEAPELESAVQAGKECAVIESVKSAADIYAPIAGTVVAVNDALEEAPETVNNSPYDAGWLFKIQPVNVKDTEALLDDKQYAQVIQ